MRKRQKQVGGDHYSKLPESPYRYIRKNFGPGHFIGCCIKYVSRYHTLRDTEDIKKVIEYCEMELDYVNSLRLGEPDGTEQLARRVTDGKQEHQERL